MSETSNITINSNSGSSKGSFFDNLLDNIFKWGILLLGAFVIIIVGLILYFVFFSDIGDKISSALDIANPFSIAFGPLSGLFVVGGWLGRLFR